MSIRQYLIPAYLMMCVFLGGATLAGYLPNLILQLTALPIIVVALMRKHLEQSAPARMLLIFLAAMIVLVLVQLIPLPPSIWSALPDRDRIVDGYAMLGQPLPWLPLSLRPHATLAALLWYLPAIAGLLGVLRLGAYGNTVLACSLVAATLISVVVASLQLTGGRSSPFYFYQVTNFGFGVGFFANSNHQATLLLCTAPFLAALYAHKGKTRSAKASSGLVVTLVGVAVILLVGIAIGGSLAGLGLGAGVALSSLLLLRYRSKPVPAWAPGAAVVGLVLAAGLIFFAPLRGVNLSQEAETSTSSRQVMISTTAEAAAAHMPVGSGLGTFPAIYKIFEDPAQVSETWVNHAHSDAVEIVLETGLPGLLLILIFLFWWGRRAYALWRADERPDHFGRAAVIATAAVIAHSFVDYPLRTAAISTLFAICLAMMAQPRVASKKKRLAGEGEQQPVRHLQA